MDAELMVGATKSQPTSAIQKKGFQKRKDLDPWGRHSDGLNVHIYCFCNKEGNKTYFYLRDLLKAVDTFPDTL